MKAVWSLEGRSDHGKGPTLLESAMNDHSCSPQEWKKPTSDPWYLQEGVPKGEVNLRPKTFPSPSMSSSVIVQSLAVLRACFVVL